MANRPASREQIANWLEDGLDRDATHVLIACRDNVDFPIFVKPKGKAWEIVAKLQKAGIHVHEVYKLTEDLEDQLNATRAFRW